MSTEVLDELMEKWGDKSGDGDLRDEMMADQEATKVILVYFI